MTPNQHPMGGIRRRRCTGCNFLVQVAVLDQEGRCESCQTQLDLFPATATASEDGGAR